MWPCASRPANLGAIRDAVSRITNRETWPIAANNMRKEHQAQPSFLVRCVCEKYDEATGGVGRLRRYGHTPRCEDLTNTNFIKQFGSTEVVDQVLPLLRRRRESQYMAAPTANLPEGLRYRAFLSYRGLDRRTAEWLHKKLERFRTPKSLVGSTGTHGQVPEQLGRIFRDREEARTGDDVETILAAELAKSQHLIVLCTPAAASPESWVSREIEIFRERRPGAEIHAIIGAGEPPHCFPAPLLRRADGTPYQPLAADMRSRRQGGDGPERAAIKLIAGLLGVPFDALWRRERRRRFARQARMIAAVALVAFAGLYVTLWIGATTRSRSFAAASAYEYSQGKVDLAAALALSGLPQPNSLLGLFWPSDAEDALVRTAAHILQSEEIEDPNSSWSAPKHNHILARVNWTDQTISLYDLQLETTTEFAFAGACASALRAGGSPQCVMETFDIDGSGQQVVVSFGDGSAWRIEAGGKTTMLVGPSCALDRNPGESFEETERRTVLCRLAVVKLSSDGDAAAIGARPGFLTVVDFRTGAIQHADYSSECDGGDSSDLCRSAAMQIVETGSSFVVVRPRGGASWWFPDIGIHLNFPRPLASVLPGPYDGVTALTFDRTLAIQYRTQLDGDFRPVALDVETEMQPSVPICTAISGCRTFTAFAVSRPVNAGSGVALAIENNAISIHGRFDLDLTVPCESNPRTLMIALSQNERCSVTSLQFSADGSLLAAQANDGVLRVYKFRTVGVQTQNGELVAAIPGIELIAFSADSRALLVDSGGFRRWYQIPGDAGVAQYGVTPEARPLHGGALRAALCARLADHASPLTAIPDADFQGVQGAFPTLQLGAADQNPCAARSGWSALF